MKEGDFIRIDYVGRIGESKDIFDLTREDVAKENGIYNPNFKYGPVPIIIGANLLVKGLEDGLKTMEVGEKKEIIVKPEEAFGERSPELIKLVPLSEFKRQNITPYPGMLVTVRNINGRVLSVSGGRVRVDFNHPLAGKSLEYDMEIKGEITDQKEKIKAILEYFLKTDEKDLDVTINGEVVEITMKGKEDVPREVKTVITNTITKWINEIKKVRFIEEY